MRAAAGWAAVIALALALLIAPGRSGAAPAPSLQVTPGSGSYGGQSVTWKGNVGAAGVQRIHLQRRGTPGAAWADVRDSNFTTAADGSFSFRFPSPAMNAVYFRVVSNEGATPAYFFETKHQDAHLSVREATPLPSDVPLPRGFAVIGEPFSIAVDTVQGARGETKPVLAGRRVTLQVRKDGPWADAATGAIGDNGTLSFGPYGPGAAPQVAGFYRVILGDWTKNGDRVGWFPSLPLYLRLVDRPRPVTDLVATSLANSVTLTWKLPSDPERARVVVVRRAGSSSPTPTAAKPSNIVAKLPATAGQYVDLQVLPGATYKYAVYTVSADGVYTALEARTQTTTSLRRAD